MKVFLGGTCSGWKWRDELQPLLKCDYYNPIVENWREVYERQNSDYVLYGITNGIKGVYLIAEVVDDSNKRPEKTLFLNLYKEEISFAASGGIDLYLNGIKVLGVDVGLHDISYGIMNYDFRFAAGVGFTVERMLADKIRAILSRSRFRRTKDLFDFYALITTFDFSYDLLQCCITARGIVGWENIAFTEEVLREYKSAWDKLVLTSSITERQLTKPDFQMVIELFDMIAVPLKNQEIFKEWNHKFQCWR